MLKDIDLLYYSLIQKIQKGRKQILIENPSRRIYNHSVGKKTEVQVKRKALFFVLVLFLLARVASAQGLTKIAENVYSYVDVKDASAQNSFGANAGIVIGEKGILVVDTLISAKEAQRLIKDIRAISDKPIRYIVNTHFHLDHAFGNSEFKKLEAVIISQSKTEKELRENGEPTLKQIAVFGLSASDMEGTSISYPDITFEKSLRIDLGGQIVELIYPGPSHTGGSILVYLRDKKLLFAGDALFTNMHPNIGDGDLKSWLKVLDFISGLDAEAIIPGHGPLSTKKDVKDMRAYLVFFDKKAKALSARSQDLAYLTSEMKKALPPRAQGEWMIEYNLQKYIKGNK